MADKYAEYKKILYGKNYTTNEKYKKNQQTINNYKARLEAGGVDVDKETDKRNFLEKALNLKQDQNFIFDIFELINRPQQALFGGLENMQQGGDFLEGAKKGITGDKRTQFKDILMNTGEFDDTKGRLDLVDALGFAGDVFLDPMDIPFIPISAASKGATVGAKVADTALDAAKAADTATDVLKAADTASDAVKFISPTQGLGLLAKAGIGKAANIADEGIEALLKAYDKSKGITYVNPDMKWASELGKMGEGTALLEIYKGMKNNLSTMFTTGLSKEARYADKINEAKQELAGRYLKANADELTTLIENTAKKLGKPTDEVARDLNKVVDVVDKISLKDVIEGAENGTVKYSKKIENALIDLANDDPDRAKKLIEQIGKDKNGMLVLGENWYKKGALTNLKADKLEALVKRPSLYSRAEQKAIKELKKYYAENAPETVKAIQDFYNNGNKVIGHTFDVFEGIDDKFDLRNLEGYSKHKVSDLYNENVQKLIDFGANPNDIKNQIIEKQGSMSNMGAATLNSRKYNMPLGEANILKKRELMNLPGLTDKGREFIKNNVDLFDESVNAGIQDYINNMPRYAKNTQMIDEILMKQGFGDLKQMGKLKSNMKVTNIIDAAKSNSLEYTDELKNALTDIANDNPKMAKELTEQIIKNKKTGKLVLGNAWYDKNVLNKLDSNKIEKLTKDFVTNSASEYNKLLENSPFRILENGRAPYGFKRLDGDTKDYLVDFLRSTGKKTGNEELVKMAKDLNKLDNVAIDPTVLNILKVSIDKPTKNEFLKIYDGLLNYFKGNKTMSLTNQMNNLGGNTMNMFMAGMDGKDYAKYVTQAVEDLKDYDKILDKAAKTIDPETGFLTLEGLTDNEKRIFNRVNSFQSNVTLLSDEKILEKYEIEGVLKKPEKGKMPKILDPARRAMAKLNATEDKIFKYAMYSKALDDPNFIRNMGIELANNATSDLIERAAGEAVGKALFDPADLTAFEKTALKRFVPFYTFTKKNLAYQISNMGNNLQKYNKLMKTYNSAISNFGDNYDNIADYLKENMYIPIPKIDKDGNYKFIRAQLPFGDLIEFANNPMEGLVNKTTPAIKLPIELVTNKNTFTGNDIEQFPGQYGNIGILKKVPGLRTAKGQQILNDLTGLDMPLKQIDKVISAFKEGNPRDAFLNNVTIKGNVNTDKLNKTYDEIDELKTLMKQYEQKGYQFSTLQELKKANKNGTVANLNSIFAKYGIK